MAKSTFKESAARGQTMRTDTGPEREEKVPHVSHREAVMGSQLKGGESDLSHSIRGNKVARPGERE